MECDVVDGVFIVQALVEIDEFVDVEFAYFAQSRAAWTAALRVVEREGVAISYEWFAHTREQQSHQRIDVGVCTHSRAAVLCRLLLVDDYGYGQSFDAFHMRASVFRQVLLYEGWERVVEFAPRFCSNCVEHERRFARARHACEYCYLILRNLKRHVLQVVLVCPAYGYHRAFLAAYTSSTVIGFCLCPSTRAPSSVMR